MKTAIIAFIKIFTIVKYFDIHLIHFIKRLSKKIDILPQFDAHTYLDQL